MAELSYDKLVKFLKGNSEASQKAAADNQNLSIGQVSMLTFCKAKVEAGVVTKARPATGPTVKKLRLAGDRWEMIAARTGLSVSQVKDLAKEQGVLDAPAAKGRTASGNGKAAPKGKAAAGKTGGKAAPAATGKAKAGQIVRNRGRGARNPS